MPRRREVTKRDTLPDPKYGSKLAARFINSIMRRGKKSIAERIFYDALDIVA
jgi:small subunit ribosomal protein S7